MPVVHHASDLEIRPMRPEERQEAQHVATRAFRTNALDQFVEEAALVGTTREGRIVTCMNVVPHAMWWGEAHVPGTSLGWVATHPEHQRKGYAAAMLIGGLRHFHEQGWAVCPIWPFSLAYYRKFGWDWTVPDRVLNLWPDMLRRLEVEPGTLREATEADRPAIRAVYERAARRYNGCSVRGEDWWRRLMRGRRGDPRMWVHLDADGAVDAHASLEIGRIENGQGRRVQVRELFGASPAAEAAAARAMAELPDVAQVKLLLAADSRLLDLFPDRVPIESPQRLSVRVVDAARALEALRPPADLRGRLAFELTDWVIGGETAIRLTVECEGGALRVSAGEHPDALRMPIHVFARLFCGALRAGEARTMAALAGGSSAMDRLCDALLYGRTPYRSENEPG